MIAMDEHVNWMKVAHLLSNFSLNHTAPFCESQSISKLLMAFSNVHSRERNYLSLMYIVYANTSKKTPY